MSLKFSSLNIIQPFHPRYDFSSLQERSSKKKKIKELQKFLNEIGNDFSDENNCTGDFLMKVHIRISLNYPNVKIENVNKNPNLLHVNMNLHVIIEEILLSGHSETKRTIRTTAYNII
ncbi:hypothetical protein AVEN_44396-1 [Araneus ventricosus]|uniref:Uncharacterized protein n=1 Tax=Araneus ventricosus TaxID=182803 RepID=A0A4Y2K6I3_ARAVE|nr:hypothetical protein AVEN_44396-1 [Araneus ventricosus]